MLKQIIYPNNKGGIDLITPALDCGISLEEIARKDVPAGKPYIILDAAEIPSDFTFFDAWESDFSTNHGIGLGSQQWFIEQYQAEIAAINAEPMPARLPDREQTAEEYDAVVAQWEASKAVRIEQLNKQIATQQAELEALA